MALKANKKKKRATWQGRRQAAAVAEAARESREGQESDGGTAILSPTASVERDAGLIRVAIAEDWPTTPEKRGIVVERLMGIVEKTEVKTITADGREVADENTADKNAMTAAKTLAAMVAHNQRVRAGSQQREQPQPQTTINVGVNVDARLDERRNRTLAIAERIRAGRVLVSDPGGID